MKTEKEAQQMWCPMEPRSYNEGGVTFKEQKCAASKCMMWRWDIEINQDPSTATRGYCGLSGPQWI